MGGKKNIFCGLLPTMSGSVYLIGHLSAFCLPFPITQTFGCMRPPSLMGGASYVWVGGVVAWFVFGGRRDIEGVLDGFE